MDATSQPGKAPGPAGPRPVVAPGRVQRPRLYEQIVQLLVDLIREQGLGLAGAANRRARFLSAGMRKRLALARAWLLARPVTLVDEPFANLDEGGRALVLELLGDLARRGVTLVVAAHEPGLARQVAPRAVRLAAGRVEEDRGA